MGTYVFWFQASAIQARILEIDELFWLGLSAIVFLVGADLSLSSLWRNHLLRSVSENRQERVSEITRIYVFTNDSRCWVA